MGRFLQRACVAPGNSGKICCIFHTQDAHPFPMSQIYVRICPVCETENAAEASICACGASLSGVDFSLLMPPAAAQAVEVKPELSSVTLISCPHADCGQPNPAGEVRCLYCNRPLVGVGLDATSSLRAWLTATPRSRDELRQMVAKLATALADIHDRQILYRDLKPENILVRSLQPLDLALADLGSTPAQQGAQLFTSAARTAHYAAPEALAGVLDAKADWWALGMIALEAVTGKHPFEGLSDQVAHHQLATQAVDVHAVFDEDWRKLCRGLLLRNPAQRWGAREVQRWLAGDTSLPMPEDSSGKPLVSFRIGEMECLTAGELALGLARHWVDGARDLKRGEVMLWLRQQLKDQNLVRALQDIQDIRDLSDDMRLFRFLIAANPDMPLLWRGKAITPETILNMSRLALDSSHEGNKDALIWLESLAAESVLAACALPSPTLPSQRERGKSGSLREIHVNSDAARFGLAWQAGWERFCALWETANQAEANWRATPKSMDGQDSSAYVDIDEVMYSRPLRVAQPSRRSQNARLLLVLNDPGFLELTRKEVLLGQAEVGTHCPWFDSLGDLSQLDPAGVLVLRQLLPFAQEDARDERKRTGDIDGQREQNIALIRIRLQTNLNALTDAIHCDTFDRAACESLRHQLDQFSETTHWALGFSYADQSFQKLRESVEQLARLTRYVEQHLDELEHAESINAIFFQPYRLLLGASILAVFYHLAGLWVPLVVGTGAAIYLGSRYLSIRSIRKKLSNVFSRFSLKSVEITKKWGSITHTRVTKKTKGQ
ncbi:MAG: protein kinase [Sulfuricellaceae bacterium]|nr:protein kinase [Sulfuricellaceae bacterium]